MLAPLTPLLPIRRCGAEAPVTSYRCTLRLNHSGDHQTWLSARLVHGWRQ